MGEENKDQNRQDQPQDNIQGNLSKSQEISREELSVGGVNKWKEVLSALERKLTEEREVYQEKIKEIKEAYDSLRLRLETREKELSFEAEKYKEAAKISEEKKELLVRKHKEDEDRLNCEWESKLKAKDNEIYSVRNELHVIHNRDEEEARSLRQQILHIQEESRKHLDQNDQEIISLSEEKARLSGRMAQRETELKSEFERTLFDTERRIRGSLESEINRLKISLEQEKTANDVMQIKLKEMATLRADLEFKENHIRNIYAEKQSVEKMKKDADEELQNSRIEHDKERVIWEKSLEERNANIRDLLRDKDNLNTQIESYKQEVKDYQLKIEAREREWERRKTELEQLLLERNKRITELEADMADAKSRIEILERERRAEQEKIDKALSSDLNRVLARLEMERSTMESGFTEPADENGQNNETKQTGG